MIISRLKSLTKYFLFCSLLFITACYENVEGCLDITAENYNAVADVDCDDCCTYPQLEVLLNSSFDTLSFSKETKYVRDEVDTLIIHDMYMLFSEFIIQGASQTYRVSDIHSFDGVTPVIDDLLFEDFTNTSSEVGTIVVNDSLISLSFQVGLVEAMDDKDYNFSQHEDVEEIIDSMYFDNSDQIGFFRLDYSHISGNDTLQQQVLVTGQDQVFTETFQIEESINYGENIVISLEIDLLGLFSGIDFENFTTEEIEIIIVNNLRSNLFN